MQKKKRIILIAASAAFFSLGLFLALFGNGDDRSDSIALTPILVSVFIMMIPIMTRRKEEEDNS